MNKRIIIFVGTKDVLAIIEKVKTIEQDSFDLFLSFLLIHSSGCRSPPNPFNFEILKLNGGKNMRIINIDNYEVCEENGRFIAASFKDYEGISHQVEITKELEEYFKQVRKEEFRENWETRFHIDLGIHSTEDVFDIQISIKSNTESAEDVFLKIETEKKIKNEIEKLPLKQQKDTYLHIIKDYSCAEIARIDNVYKSTAKRNIDAGIKKLAKKYKKN